MGPAYAGAPFSASDSSRTAHCRRRHHGKGASRESLSPEVKASFGAFDCVEGDHCEEPRDRSAVKAAADGR
ncbi:MAG TPA: hypothetical protein VME92_21935, partial [Acetobacteraceae bacterium]|nr:hypothetical protein [Acetobacteraceae bacterium]